MITKQDQKTAEELLREVEKESKNKIDFKKMFYYDIWKQEQEELRK